jgi:ribonuclease E
MLDDDNTSQNQTTAQSTSSPVRRTRRRAASRPAGPPEPSGSPRSVDATPHPDRDRSTESAPPAPATTAEPSSPAADTESVPTMTAEPTPTASAEPVTTASAESPPARKPAKRSRRKAASAEPDAAVDDTSVPTGADTTPPPDGDAVRTSSRGRHAAPSEEPQAEAPQSDLSSAELSASDESLPVSQGGSSRRRAPATTSPVPLFQAPDPATLPVTAPASDPEPDLTPSGGDSTPTGKEDAEGTGNRRRRSRGGRKRGKSSGDADPSATSTSTEPAEGSTSDVGSSAETVSTEGAEAAGDAPRGDEDSGSSHRRRRRRRTGEDSGDGTDDAATTVRVRAPRAKKETITSVEGSTRIEAKKQRRREGREAGRRRPPILSESEFLARRESVERVMAIRQRGDVTQIGVLEDDVLVEHYVALESQSSLIGNVYIGRVQNVLPSMEAAFIDIGKGRNAVLYAGEVNWDMLGGSHQARRIENALKPGQTVLVQVSKDPVGHKGARLTSQITLPGRYLVYVPGGGSSGISRKLADTERSRLKTLISDILPDSAGVIIRTAAEGASEEELTRDVTRLTARWEDIEKKVKAGQAPALVYGEPDTTIRVVRDLFTEDFTRLVISGDDAWDMVNAYVQHVAPDLIDRIERFDGDGDIFDDLRVEEQIAKALERKVWLPSGGSLVIDRTEAMTVVDVNTGKFTGSGGNLEETVTKNNLEAAEEIVRQLRLRDIGGIIVIDFIDMVLEDNRDLVLRRLVECLGRDRTRHQVAEVTSLGLVQMTRKRISTGLIEAFSHPCDVCSGRGVVIEQEPVLGRKADEPHTHSAGPSGSNASRGPKRSSNRRRGAKSAGSETAASAEPSEPSSAAEQSAPPAVSMPDLADGAGPRAAPAAGANGSGEAAAVLTEVTVGP